MSDDTTRMPGDNPGTDETRMAPSTPHVTTSHSGWLSSTGSVDHGRFAPGTMLDNRYRVLGLLGRGGMGEVYRADDLRLGQQVALKFLPETLAVDARRLAQFHNEVRTARQVSHPNVCRVYDIGEIAIGNDQSLLFLTMEYVDGEDLSILLRRIGRLPEERAIEIARQICSGLAAAHERGILHRDLKPANIMLDSAGRVRIMDFSLAAIGQVEDVRAGTPAYMAPEQLSGLEVTVRSDIYALGLVLYEVFTGRRAFEAKTVADLVAQHQSGTITSPSQLVSSLDPVVDRAIMRCLDPEPSRRPPSALAVGASLPGGDPLAAAIAAGETPSPEMVAAAGGQGAAIGVAAGAFWTIVLVAALFASVKIADRTSLFARTPMTKPVEVLSDRADELRKSFGYTDSPADKSHSFTVDTDYLAWVNHNRRDKNRWSDLENGRPGAMLFWQRASPMVLVPRSSLSAVSQTDPPLNINGMTHVVLDTAGRLIRFHAAPPQAETPPPETPAAVDWDKLFAAAAIDRSTFVESVPARTPATYADERRAWAGTLPGTTIPVRIEAAGYRGRAVMFEIVAPWTTAGRDSKATPRSNNGNPFFIALLLIGAIAAARANLKSGRADRRGAFRIATFTFAIILGTWLMADHVPDASNEQQRFFSSTGIALFLGAVMYLIYLGLEPFVRRSSPAVLIGWSRALAGRFRDPLVGRDVLLGAAIGAVSALLNLLPFILPIWLGRPESSPYLSNAGALEGVRPFLVNVLEAFNSALQNALITVFEWVTFRVVVEWIWAHTVMRYRKSAGPLPETAILVIAIVLATTVSVMDVEPGNRIATAVFQMLSMTVLLGAILRIGLFGAAISLLVSSFISDLPMTLDNSKLYASASWALIAFTVGIGVLGLWMARSGDSISKRFERAR